MEIHLSSLPSIQDHSVRVKVWPVYKHVADIAQKRLGLLYVAYMSEMA